MIKIRKIIFVLAFLLSVSLVSAANIGVVVEFPNGTIVNECVGVSDNSDGYDTLEKTGLDIIWSDEGQWGHALCKISDVGEEVSGTSCAWGSEYWGFFVAEDNDFSYSPVGVDAPGDCWNRDFSSYGGHYCALDRDVLGFAHGAYGTEPTFYSYEEICPEMLKIKDIKAYVDGDKKSGVDETGGRIKDVKPDSTIKLKIEVENLYSEEADIEITDVNAVGIIKDIDDGDEIEEESDETDLDAEDKETIEIEFEIPLEVEDKDFDLELTIEGKDEKDIEYKQIIDFEVEIEKEKHELLIKRATLSNTNLKCSRTTQFSFSVMNLGKDNEDVTLTIFNADLELNKQDSFSLDDDPFDSDSKYSNSYPINIDKEQEAGIYPINIRLEYSDETKEEIIELKIEDCKTTTTETSSETITQQENTVEESYTELTPITTAATAETQKQSKNELLAPMLIITVDILAIMAGILIFLKVFRK